jgi:hypothetical protein
MGGEKPAKKKRRPYGRGGVSKTTSGKWSASWYATVRSANGETTRARRKKICPSESAAKKYLRAKQEELQREELQREESDAVEEERLARGWAENNCYALQGLVKEWLQSFSEGDSPLRRKTISAKRERLLGRPMPPKDKPRAHDRRYPSEYAIFGSEFLMTVSDVKLRDVKAFVSRRRSAGVGDATLKLQIGDARRCLAWGVEEGKIRYNILGACRSTPSGEVEPALPAALLPSRSSMGTVAAGRGRSGPLPPTIATRRTPVASSGTASIGCASRTRTAIRTARREALSVGTA